MYKRQHPHTCLLTPVRDLVGACGPGSRLGPETRVLGEAGWWGHGMAEYPPAGFPESAGTPTTNAPSSLWDTQQGGPPGMTMPPQEAVIEG